MQLKDYRKKKVYYKDLHSEKRRKKKVPLCKRWGSINLVETEMQYFFFF